MCGGCRIGLVLDESAHSGCNAASSLCHVSADESLESALILRASRTTCSRMKRRLDIVKLALNGRERPEYQASQE